MSATLRKSLGWLCLLAGKLASLVLLYAWMVAADGVPGRADGGIAGSLERFGTLPLLALTVALVVAGVLILRREALR